jgi:hypothetical protein
MDCFVEANNRPRYGQFTAVMARNCYLRATRIKVLRGRHPEEDVILKPGFSRVKDLARVSTDVNVERRGLNAH